MEIINLAANSIPLSTKYVGDDDFYFKGILEYTEEGYSIFRENYLKNASDNKINNYSSICLTDKQKLSDLFDIDRLPENNKLESFNTSLRSIDNDLYLTLSSVYVPLSTVPYYFTRKNTKYVDDSDKIFEITLLDPISAKILHKNKNRIIYYLNYVNSEFKFLSTDEESSIFNYILDKKNNKLVLIKDNKVFSIEDNAIEKRSINYFKDYYFNINYYIQHLNPKLNSSWVSYDKHNKNVNQIIDSRSRSDLMNNCLVTSQYSYITGDRIEANVLVLKNQKTNKNYSYRSDYTENFNENVPVVDARNYCGIFSGNEQEKGDYSITLSYEFYNADYKFEADAYTKFFSPESLYPYKQININDLKWKYNGSIAGENPYLSDKVFQKRETLDTGGEYLCSWLHKDKDGGATWLDRYYYPEKTTYSNALKTAFNYNYTDPLNALLHSKLLSSEYYDVPDIYNSLQEEYEHTPQTDEYALYGISFFDKRSDLVIKPNTEYVYYRIGNKYVKDIISNLSNDLVTDLLDLRNSKKSTIYLGNQEKDNIEYTLNNDAYANINNYKGINEVHEFTVSFWFKTDDWNSNFGHQIVGNLNSKGFAVLNDRKITPFIMVQSNQKVYIYNTDFNLIDIASVENETVSGTNIRDIHRTDHLDSFYTINGKPYTYKKEDEETGSKFTTSYTEYNIPLITNFYSNAAIYDGMGDSSTEYVSMVYDQNYVYFLMNSSGKTVRFNKTTEEMVYLKQYDNDKLLSYYSPLVILPKISTLITPYGRDAIEKPVKYERDVNVPKGLDNIKFLTNDLIIENFMPAEYIYKSNNTEKIYSIVKDNGSMYGFSGYDAKKFTNDSVLYIKDNTQLVQESYNRQNITVHLSSKTKIRDFIIDDEYNYFVIHNENKISKFSKDRVFQYTIKVDAVNDSEFSLLSLTQFNGIELIKLDMVREYTDSGLKMYPIILGKIKNGNGTLSANQMFLAKLDEVNRKVTNVTFTSLTGSYYEYGNSNKVNYNLTNYNYLKNRYKSKNELIFKLTLQNIYNSPDKIFVEIPIDVSNFESEYHYFAFVANGKEGYVTVYCDGVEIKTVHFQPAQYIFQDIFNESINVGNTYFYNDISLSDYIGQSNYYYIRDSKLKQFKLYKKALTNSEILFHLYDGIKMNDLVVSLPCDQRNELDGIERQFKLDTNGSKSNKVNILIKNSQITNTILQEKLSEIIKEKLKTVLPITTTINNIEYR